MEFIVKTPALMGEIVNLYEVARSMALARASAGGHGLHLPAYHGHLERRCTWLTDEARLGRLPVCDGSGIPRTWDELMLDGEPLDGRVACTKAWVNLKPLNAWGAPHDYIYRVTSDGVAWIDERGVLGGALPAGRFHVEAERMCEVTGKVVGVETALDVVLEQPDGGLSPQRGESAAKNGVAGVVAESASSAPLVAGSASNEPLPLTTGDIAFCFDGIRWSEKGWRKPLGDKPKWLQSCVAIPGQRGVSETRWNPVLIAAALVDDGHTQARSIRARFQTKPQLRDWLEAWKTYEADNFDTQ